MTKKDLIAHKFIKELNGAEILTPVTNTTILFQEDPWTSSKYFDDYFDDRSKYIKLQSVNSKEGIMYFNISKNKNLLNEVFFKYWKNPNFLANREKFFEDSVKKIDKLYEKLTTDYINSTKHEISIKFYHEMKDLTLRINAATLFSFYFDKEMCKKYLKDINFNIKERRLDELWEFAGSSNFISFSQNRSLDVANNHLKKISPNKLSNNLQYICSAYNKVVPLEGVINFINDNYKEEIENPELFIHKTDKHIKDSKLKYARLLKEFTSEEIKLISFIQTLIRYRDKTKNPLAKLMAVIYRFADHIYSQIGDEKDLIYFTKMSEIESGKNFIKKNLPKIRLRTRGYSSLTYYDGTQEEQYGLYEENKKILYDYYKKQEKEAFNDLTLKGQTGSKGYVKARVRVITNLNEQANSFKEGEVLVTGMTRPEFVPLMKKASAIVTDEGGITCHAAIVSREMKKPCVIGTKKATQVLKDGDLVEVDANNGIVRICN